MELKHTYYFKWSYFVAILTIISAALFLILPIYLVLSTDGSDYYIMASVFLTIFFVMFWSMPLGIKNDGTYLSIIRPFKNIRIPTSEIISVRPVALSALEGTIRLMASGGMFGYFGKFRNDTFGTFHMYTMGLKDLVVIKTKRAIYVTSCKNHGAFIVPTNNKEIR